MTDATADRADATADVPAEAPVSRPGLGTNAQGASNEEVPPYVGATSIKNTQDAGELATVGEAMLAKNPQAGYDFWGTAPDVVLQEIFMLLDPEMAGSITFVCKGWEYFTRHAETLWCEQLLSPLLPQGNLVHMTLYIYGIKLVLQHE
jgi:hypothetical protein